MGYFLPFNLFRFSSVYGNFLFSLFFRRRGRPLGLFDYFQIRCGPYFHTKGVFGEIHLNMVLTLVGFAYHRSITGRFFRVFYQRFGQLGTLYFYTMVRPMFVVVTISTFVVRPHHEVSFFGSFHFIEQAVTGMVFYTKGGFHKQVF